MLCRGIIDHLNPRGFVNIYQGKIPNCVRHDVNISDWECNDTKFDPCVFSRIEENDDVSVSHQHKD